MNTGSQKHVAETGLERIDELLMEFVFEAFTGLDFQPGNQRGRQDKIKAPGEG